MKKRWKRRCENCRWYSVKEPLADEEVPWGYCFESPPRDGSSIRPIVNWHDRCARWDERLPEQYEELL